MARKDYYHCADAPKANRIVPATSAIVQNQDGEILLHLRTDNEFWSLPGGAIDIGETAAQSIVREVLEETGFNMEIDGLVGIYSDPYHVIAYSDGEVRQQFSICFFGHVVSGAIAVSDESREVRFFQKSEIDGLKIHPANRLRIDDFFKKLGGPVFR